MLPSHMIVQVVLVKEAFVTHVTREPSSFVTHMLLLNVPTPVGHFGIKLATHSAFDAAINQGLESIEIIVIDS